MGTWRVASLQPLLGLDWNCENSTSPPTDSLRCVPEPTQGFGVGVYGVNFEDRVVPVECINANEERPHPDPPVEPLNVVYGGKYPPPTGTINPPIAGT